MNTASKMNVDGSKKETAVSILSSNKSHHQSHHHLGKEKQGMKSKSRVVIKITKPSESELNLNRHQVANTDSTLKFQPFDQAELGYLGMKFSHGMIKIDEFMKKPQLYYNPLLSRILKIFDADNTGFINFHTFVKQLSVFSSNDRMGQLKLSFRLFDVDRDGFISAGELFQVLKLIVQDSIESTALQQIVDKAIIYADRDRDGKISFPEFVHMVKAVGTERKLVLLNL